MWFLYVNKEGIIMNKTNLKYTKYNDICFSEESMKKWKEARIAASYKFARIENNRYDTLSNTALAFCSAFSIALILVYIYILFI